MADLNIEAERVLFEQAARKLHPDMYFDLCFDGEYKHGLARDLWPLWQAARSAISTNVVPAQGEHSGRVAVPDKATPAIREVIKSIGTSSGEGWSDKDSDECWKELLAAAHKAQQERGQ